MTSPTRMTEASSARTNNKSSTTRQKACSACTKAKRRCDLCHPACRRCVVKGIECYYPSTRLHDRPSSQTQKIKSSPSSTAVSVRRRHSTSVQRQRRNNEKDEEDLLGSVDNAILDFINERDSFLPFPSPVTSISSSYSERYDAVQNPNQFFLSPGSWLVVQYSRVSPRQDYKIPYFNSSIQQVLRWIKQWVDEGSTMFIHKRLYQDQLPKCIQDAYTACAAYFSCTERNRRMVLRIIEERVAMLLEEQAAQADAFECSRGKGAGVVAGVPEHLARVQALLVYQTLRLFDGDERQREMAEELIPTLRLWSMQMLECALLSSEYVRSVPKQLTSVYHQATPLEKKQHSEWQAWILAESVRRTWLVAGHTQCIYSLLRYGVSVCPGGLMFTTRAGLWDADSAFEWWEQCRQKDVLFLQSLETEKQLLRRTTPDEVDDFGRFVLGIIAKERENVNNWLALGNKIGV